MAQTSEPAREPEAAVQDARAAQDEAGRGRARGASRTSTIIGMPAVVATGVGAPREGAAGPGGADGEPGRWWPSAPLTLGRFHFDQELALGPYGASYAGREAEGGAGAGRGGKAPGAVHATLFHPALFADAVKKKAQRARVERALRYQSPYVAPTYAVGEAHGTIYAVTAPVFGVPLTHWRRDVGALGAEGIYRITGQLLDAMEAIHAQGGVHGGLSPETLRIVQDRVWVTSPWWLEAAEVPADEVQPQRAAWLAPELIFGEAAETPATDVYGVGLTLGYLLACGLTEPGHSLLVQGIDVAPELDDVYVRATARQKEARYQDVASLRAALAAAGGVEWRDAQLKTLHAARRGGLAAVEVLDVRPRTRPPERRPTGPELVAVPVVARPEPPPPPREVARAEPDEDDDANLPEPPPIVPTESVLAAVVGRSALGDLERTVEDTVRPVFDEESRDEERISGLLRLGVEPGGPISRRSQRVTPRTLLHGTPKPSSATVAAAEVPLDEATRGGPGGAVDALVPRNYDATDGLPAHYLTDELFRQLTEGTEVAPPPPPSPRPGTATGAQGQAAVVGSVDGKTPVRPPPLPGETRPRWQTRSSWGSTLEALDVGGPAAVAPPAPVLPEPAPPQVMTPSAPVVAAPIVEVPPAVPTSVLSGGAASGFGEEPDEGATIPSEPTVIEGIAPALLEVDVFGAEPLAPLPPAPVDPLAPAPEPPPNPWSDSPLVTVARTAPQLPPAPPPISATVGIAELLAGVGLGDEPEAVARAEDKAFAGPGSRAEPRPQALTTPPSGVPMVTALSAAGALIDQPISRGPVTRPKEARPDAGAARTPTTRDEPRILRDPSGPLAGASASLAGIPIRPAGHVPTITTGRPIADTARGKRPRTALWAALALAVGVAVALAVIGLGGGGKGTDPGAGRELASVGNGALGGGARGADEREGTTGPGGVALIPGEAEPDAQGGDGGGAVGAVGGADAVGAAGLVAEVGEDTGSTGVEAEGAADASALAGAADGTSGGPEGEGADAALAASVLPGPGDASAQTVSVDAADAIGDRGDAAREQGPDTSTVHAAEVAEESAPDAVVAEVADTKGPAETVDAAEQVVFEPKDPNKLKCPDGMLKLKRKITVTLANGQKAQDWDVACIDRFEFPGAGAVPRTGVDLGGARAACAQKGKRLCTRSEWRRACGFTYPYGKEYDATRCNTAGDDGTPRPLVGAGTKKGCMSPSGAFDMVGNAAEWTSDGTINGGAAQRNAADATCGSASKRIGGAPHIGFRCCVDAKE